MLLKAIHLEVELRDLYEVYKNFNEVSRIKRKYFNERTCLILAFYDSDSCIVYSEFGICILVIHYLEDLTRLSEKSDSLCIKITFNTKLLDFNKLAGYFIESELYCDIDINHDKIHSLKISERVSLNIYLREIHDVNISTERIFNNYNIISKKFVIQIIQNFVKIHLHLRDTHFCSSDGTIQYSYRNLKLKLPSGLSEEGRNNFKRCFGNRIRSLYSHSNTTEYF